MNHIIDFHNHIFPENLAPKVIESVKKETGFTPFGNGTISALRREMEHSGVKISVILAVATSAQLTRPINEWILKQKAEDLIPIGSIHPSLKDYKLELNFLKKAGVKGIKFNSIFQNIRPVKKHHYVCLLGDSVNTVTILCGIKNPRIIF